MNIETLVNDEYVLVDVEQAWRETFAYWDALVPTSTAVDIAEKTVAILMRCTPERV